METYPLRRGSNYFFTKENGCLQILPQSHRDTFLTIPPYHHVTGDYLGETTTFRNGKPMPRKSSQLIKSLVIVE